ncbi:MAG TPA: ABC transporter substrate-binding protein [Acidobacteriaceae bacterium]|nr:ABC transporter substrate-binding protein [Acidobacteriaceae bacterium]
MRNPIQATPEAKLLSPNWLSRRRLLRVMGAGLATPLLVPQHLLAHALSGLPTLKPGVLRIGTYFDNPPFEFVSHGQRVGFEVDLMTEAARRLDLQPEFVETKWEGIFGEIEEQRYDCIMGGITITPRRRTLLAWSVPYMTTTLSMLVDTARSPANMTLSDLQSGTIGVQAATTDYDAAVSMQKDGKIGRVKVYSFARMSSAIADLTAGRIQAVMKVYPASAWIVQHTPELRILAQVPDDPQPLGIGFNKSNTALVAMTNRTLVRMHEDGSYRTLAKRWGLS